MTNYLLSSIEVSQREEFDAVVMARGGRKLPVAEAKGLAIYHRSLSPISAVTKALRAVPSNMVYVSDPELSLHYHGARGPISADPLWSAALSLSDDTNEPKTLKAHSKAKSPPSYESTVVESYGLLPVYANELDQIDEVSVYRRMVVEYNLQRAIFLRDMESVETLKAFIKNTTYEDDFYGARVVYLHGLFIEGIHFNTHKRAELSHAVNTLLLEGYTDNTIEIRSTPARKTPSKVTKTASSTAGPRFDWRSIEHVFITVGNVVITTCPDHHTWRSRLVSTEFDEAVFCERWSAYMTGHYQKLLDEQQHTYEKLQRELINIENQLGRTQSIIRAVKTGTSVAVRDSLLKIQSIPEIARLELRHNGLRLFTKDMLALRESTGSERYCGRFEIAIGFNGYVAIRNIASFSDDWRNPHGSCLGSFGKLFSSALRELDYYALVLALMEYYRRVDGDHDDIWDEIPNSKKPPAKVYCSAWQVIAKADPTSDDDAGYPNSQDNQEAWEASLGTHPVITIEY